MTNFKVTDRIMLGSKSCRQFIPHPQAVKDGTVRCISCGQINEDGPHIDKFCPAMGGALPQTAKVKQFVEWNKSVPVVVGSVREDKTTYYRLQNGLSFVFTPHEVRSFPKPRWLGE